MRIFVRNHNSANHPHWSPFPEAQSLYQARPAGVGFQVSRSVCSTSPCTRIRCSILVVFPASRLGCPPLPTILCMLVTVQSSGLSFLIACNTSRLIWSQLLLAIGWKRADEVEWVVEGYLGDVLCTLVVCVGYVKCIHLICKIQ